jgi:glycosyltransferase involved in cell wall biosynthesis
MKYEVSIIVPVYQVEKYIEDCAISICNQTFKDFEVILVNDGTRDRSIEIAERIFKKNKITYRVINKENKGLPSARNTGFRAAKGDWVVSIDSDDVINEHFIEKLVNHAKSANVNVAFCDLQNVSLNNIDMAPQYDNGVEIYYKRKFQKDFLKRDIVPVVATMIFKNQWLIDNDLYLDEDCFFGGDQNFIWKISFYCNKVLHIKVPLYNYLERPNSITTSPDPKKVIKGYESMRLLIVEMSMIDKDNKILRYILPRWLLGTLRTISRNGSYETFCYISDYCNAKKKMRMLYKFPDFRVKVLSLIFMINRKLFYIINNKPK